MIANISGNLGLVQQEDQSFKPYLYYRLKCTHPIDIKVKLASVFQIKYDKSYKMVAKVNEYIDTDILLIDSKEKKDFIMKWLFAAEQCKGFYLNKDYYYNSNTIPAKKEEMFVRTPVDFFFDVECAVDCIKPEFIVKV